MRGIILALLLLVGFFQAAGFATPQAKKKSTHKKAASSVKSAHVKAVAKPAAKAATTKRSVKKVSLKRQPKRSYRPAPPVDPTEGDTVEGEDLVVRRAAVQALGTKNGAVVAVDPTTGRVLSIVNQKLALKSGFVPCSTIKLVTALAGLSEHVIERTDMVRLGRYTAYNMTSAIAKSNNPYFQRLGNQLGYERVTYYAKMLGLGEKAGLDIPGEEPGVWPEKAPGGGGVGMMTAYGENILMTPLELAGVLSAIANGGTLYYLQYPKTPDEIEAFTPKVKRQLELAPHGIEDIKIGMRAAVDMGTARRAGYDANEPILGKTGTCTDFRYSSHMGWFGSFNEVDHHQIVLVVMLLGTKTVNGPVASGVAGEVYRRLSEQRYFTAEGSAVAENSRPDPNMPKILVSKSCCVQ